MTLRGAPPAVPGGRVPASSTVVNALARGEVMATGDVRAVVVDTPGLRGVALSASDEGLPQAFSDVEELASGCRFAGCAHVAEPGRAVRASIEAGDLPQARMASWRKLQREIAHQAARTDARLRPEERARWKEITKANRSRAART